MSSTSESTIEIYSKALAAENLVTDVEPLHDFHLYWIGCREASSIIVYVCGGGLLEKPNRAHFQAQVSAYQSLHAKKHNISIVVVGYGVAPTLAWPGQLKQLILAIDHLSTCRDASRIHLSGDSAGASLILSYLLHLKTSYPSLLVPTPSESLTATKFASSFLFNPTAPYPFGSASIPQIPQIDFLSQRKLEGVWDTLMSTYHGLENGKGKDEWLVPLLADGEMWKELKVAKIVAVVGGNEILRGDVLKIVEMIKKHVENDIVLYDCAGEVHCQMHFDLMTGKHSECESARHWKEWLNTLEA